MPDHPERKAAETRKDKEEEEKRIISEFPSASSFVSFGGVAAAYVSGITNNSRTTCTTILPRLIIRHVLHNATCEKQPILSPSTAILSPEFCLLPPLPTFLQQKFFPILPLDVWVRRVRRRRRSEEEASPDCAILMDREGTKGQLLRRRRENF